MGIKHLYKCRRAPTSADALYVACVRDEMFLDDGEIEDHFHFNRFLRGYQRTNIFGPSPQEVHWWRIEGSLVENIIQLFESVPERSRGSYYPWWKDNLHIFNRTMEVVDSCHAEFMEYPMSQLDPADHDKEINDLEPEAKLEAFIFFAMIVNTWVPSPETSAWYSFGFCTCRNAVLPDEGQYIPYHSESALAGLYQSLLGTVPDKSMERHFGEYHRRILFKPRCSFAEFWKAYDGGTLPSLFRKYELEKEMKQVTPHFAEFISSRWGHPSVWTLMIHLAAPKSNKTRKFRLLSWSTMGLGSVSRHVRRMRY